MKVNTNTEIEKYRHALYELKISKRPEVLLYSLKHFFKGTEFANKKVLDIGSGTGIFSFYMACEGAEKVICLEPLTEGSTGNAIETFCRIKNFLNKDNIELHQVRFQDYLARHKFDIILLNNSINHLEESACIDLLKEPSARDIYHRLLTKLYDIANNNALLIICDCSNSNFFKTLGVKNPFAPSIEWHKHQSASTWAALLMETGFVSPEIKWTSPNRLRLAGRSILSNKIAAYFLNSHFCLRMKKRT